MRHAVVVLAACVVLAGCSSGDKPDPKPSPPVTPSVAPVVPFMKAVEGADLTSYESGIPPFQELEVFPPQWCKALDSGHSVEWILGEAELYPAGQTWGTEKADAYQLVVFGVQAYCPKHSAAVLGELRTAGVY